MLDRLLGTFDQQADAPHLVSSRCLRNRYRASTCRQCADSCPEQAVFIKRTVVVDESRGSGCLACSAACPTEALVPAVSHTRQLFNKKKLESRTDRIVVACTKNPSLQPDISVECLAVFSLHDLAALTLGAKITELHLEHCPQCPRSPAIEGLRNTAAQVSRIILSNADNKLILIDKKNTYSQHVLRRTFLRSFKKTVLQAVEKQIVAEKTPLPAKKKNRHVPRRLQLLQQALNLTEKADQISAGERLYPNLTFLRHCNRCGKCVAACPAGALRKNRIKGDEIKFERFSCSGCGLCLEFCPIDAVSISSPLL